MSVFETERLTYPNDLYSINSITHGRHDKRPKRIIAILLASFGVVSTISLILSITAIVRTRQALDVTSGITKAAGNSSTQAITGQRRPTRKVAFGSCSSYDLRPQPIWTQGVIPAQPDAWIWVGDMAYLDNSPISCDVHDVQDKPWCNCTAGYMKLPGQCLAGDVDAARDRWIHAIHQPDYRTFLGFMCPPMLGSTAGTGPSAAGGSAPGRFPPAGTDPAVCPRPILGVYDDHDYGWNNGNRRLPNKSEFKQMFLDAMGEAADSPRRGADSGLQGVVTLNGGAPGRDISVVLLDERWYRDPLPCELRSDWCRYVLTKPTHKFYGWCQDFLVDDGTTGRGSCCTKDGDLAAWCSRPSSGSESLWRSACDPTSAEWGLVPMVLSADNTTLLMPDNQMWSGDSLSKLWPRLLQARDSPVCEVLGAAQRSWLSAHLNASRAPLTLLVSGSVPLGSLGFTDNSGNNCSSDDWDCWPPAQLNFLHTLANSSSGCVVLMTGDYHYADIKVLVPGSGKPYSSRLQTDKIKKHIYQVMSSGMTDSTASYSRESCNGTYREDLMGLRPLGPCAITSRPNFGMVEVDWESGMVHLTIRDAASGGIADTQGPNEVVQHVMFSLETCAPVAV